jgi:hypothetical protein
MVHARTAFSLEFAHVGPSQANTAYVREKERCKDLLDISKAKLDEVDDELRHTFQAMEEVSRHWLSTTCG